MWYLLQYFTVSHSMFTIKFHKNILCIFLHDIFTIFDEILHINVRHKSTYVSSFPPPLSHCSGFASELFRVRVRARTALPTGSIVARSGQFLGSLLSDHSAQCCCRGWCGHGCGFRLGVEYLTTALVRLYFADTSRKKRYYALLALFSWFALGRRRWLQV